MADDAAVNVSEHQVAPRTGEPVNDGEGFVHGLGREVLRHSFPEK